jgi:tRNA 2-thiouridine synthesizing protein E
MPLTTLAGRTIHVNDEGFLTDPAEWNDDLATVLAAQIGLTLTEEHWKVLRFLRKDFEEQGETATLRRVSSIGGIPIRTQVALFHQQPAKKMAYVAGLPSPSGCV